MAYCNYVTLPACIMYDSTCTQSTAIENTKNGRMHAYHLKRHHGGTEKPGEKYKTAVISHWRIGKSEKNV